MDDEANLKLALRTYLRAYNGCLKTGRPVEEADAWLWRLDALVPQAKITDLLFWGERDRSEEEVLDEAFRRERIWGSEGELALLLHLEAQLNDAASTPDLGPVHQNYVNGELPRVRKRIEALAGGSRH